MPEGGRARWSCGCSAVYRNAGRGDSARPRVGVSNRLKFLALDGASGAALKMRYAKANKPLRRAHLEAPDAPIGAVRTLFKGALAREGEED